MALRSNALEIFKYLPRTNCGDCGVPTCMAFAAAVANGQQTIGDCPHVDAAELEPLVGGKRQSPWEVFEAQRKERLAELARQFSQVDLQEAAERLGGEVVDGQLELRCLGRVFALDQQGGLHSGSHVNPWIHLPLLDHVLGGKGAEPTGNWVLFTELRGALDWSRFFTYRCEEGLRQIADADPEFFFDIMEVFNARPLTAEERQGGQFSDDAFVISPLPLVPILVSYWRPEEPFESKLTLFFDRTAEQNLSAGALYQLAQGIVEMLKRMVVTHGVV